MMADGWGGMLGMLPAESFSVQGAALPWNEVASLSVLTAVSYSKTMYWEYWLYTLFSMHSLLRTQGLFLRIIALLIQWESETSTSASQRYTYQIIMMMQLACQHKYGLLDLRNVKRETVADDGASWTTCIPHRTAWWTSKQPPARINHNVAGSAVGTTTK